MEYYTKQDQSIFNQLESQKENPKKFNPIIINKEIQICRNKLIKDDSAFFLSPLRGIVKSRRMILTKDQLIIYSVLLKRQNISQKLKFYSIFIIPELII